MRPWRLTRRARVEMEAALMALRVDLVDGGNRSPDFPTVENGAWALGVSVMGPKWIEVGTLARAHEWRILRARVALALRAALRADEDARCEEARGPECEPEDPTSWGRDCGRRDGVDALREWPECVPVSYAWPEGVPVPLSVPVLRGARFCAPMASRVPRALWEVAR